MAPICSARSVLLCPLSLCRACPCVHNAHRRLCSTCTLGGGLCIQLWSCVVRSIEASMGSTIAIAISNRKAP